MVADEEALRRVQAASEGTDPEPLLSFLDAGYAVRTSGLLTPLLRYAAIGQGTAPERARRESLGEDGPPEISEQAMLSAAHRLLEDCLEDFTSFSDAAWQGKVPIDAVREAVMRVIEIACARPPMAALRLLRYVTASLAELDGMLLLAGGGGLAAMSAREACNAAYAKLLGSIDPERVSEWKEDLYLDHDPASQALDMVRQMQAAQKAEKEKAEAGGHG